MNKPLSPQYLAGFMDGEGSISVFVRSPKSGRHQGEFCRVTVCNSNLEVILAIRDQFGGWIQTKRPRSRNHKVVYVLGWNGRKGAAILRAISPFLVIKKEQARLALEFQSTMNDPSSPRKPISSSIREHRLGIAAKLRVINQRGVGNG